MSEVTKLNSKMNEKDDIDKIVFEFCQKNKKLLKTAKRFRKGKGNLIEYKWDKSKNINKYLFNVKIMIITVNEIERQTLFAFFAGNKGYRIVRISRKNITYSFLKINGHEIVHVESDAGSYTRGGASSVIKEAKKVVKPGIVISLGVAFGINYKTDQIGDVLVGRQHFSYDKSVKISDDKLKIKRLHIVEADEYMLNRFKMNVSIEERMGGVIDNKYRVLLGNMLTGEFVVDSNEFKNIVYSPFKQFGVIGGEMEALGIFEAINKHDVHCIMIKGICDWGSGKNQEIRIEGNKNKKMHNYKNDLQTLAMINACDVCKRFLQSDYIFSDIRIKGVKKAFWRVVNNLFRWRRHLLI